MLRLLENCSCFFVEFHFFPKAFSDFENLKVESTVSSVDWTVQQSVRQSAELPKTAETGTPTSPLSLQAELDRLDFAEAIC